MDILKHTSKELRTIADVNLHSNMDILKPASSETEFALRVKFTFHYGYIKTSNQWGIL